MPDHRLHADGARVLADLHALRSIGAYKTGVHKPTFSEPHMRSLEWLAQRPPEAGSRLTSTASAMYSPGDGLYSQPFNSVRDTHSRPPVRVSPSVPTPRAA